MSRFTRLVNGFSRTAENRAPLASLDLLHHDFCRVHATLTKAMGGVHQTPAIVPGITDLV